MDLYSVLTVTAGILSAVALFGAAVAAGARLWRYRLTRWALTPVTWTFISLWLAWDSGRDARFAAKVDEAISQLFRPNGGASLHDLSERLTWIERRLGVHNQHTNPDVSAPAPEPHPPDKDPS